MTFKSYRQQSREVNWGTHTEGTNLSREQINCGSLLRIADAVEKIVEPYERLMRSRDEWMAEAKRLGAELAVEKRRTAALRGVIGRRSKVK